MQRIGVVNRKIKKFYEREKKAKFFKVTSHDADIINSNIWYNILYLDVHPSWCRNITFKVFEDGLDFERMLKTVVINYTYPKYGNC